MSSGYFLTDMTDLRKLAEFMTMNTKASVAIEKQNEMNCAEALIKRGMRYE
jgi:hypothetical protein